MATTKKNNLTGSADLLAKAIRHVFDEAMSASQEHTDDKLGAMEGRLNNHLNGIGNHLGQIGNHLGQIDNHLGQIDTQLVAIKSQVDHHQKALDGI